MFERMSIGVRGTDDQDSLLPQSSLDSIERQFSTDFSIEGEDDDLNVDEKKRDGFTDDPFKPLEGLTEDNDNILTFRAIAVGVVCGTLINASNIYLGLKSGWTASANLFASIIGFAILKKSPDMLKHLPFLGGDFGPQENNIVQTTATAAGGMSNVFTSAIPAMYQLGLLTTPAKDFWRLVSLTAVGGYFGFLFATPLRRFFIISVARDLHLIFPTPSTTAITIRNMHQSALTGSNLPKKKMQVLCWAFFFAIFLRVFSQYAIGILWARQSIPHDLVLAKLKQDWHPFTWYLLLSPTSSAALGLESWGWFIEWTPAFMGTGMLTGLNVAVYFFLGTFLAWGIIGPLLVAYGIAFGVQVPETGLTSYYAMSAEFTNATHPSPRYWLLWPGVACMVAVSLTELACQWRAFVIPSRAAWRNLREVTSKVFPSLIGRRVMREEIESSDEIKDPAGPEDLVQTWMWLPALLFTLIMACVVMKYQFGMPVRETLLALIMAVLFSFLAIQATGATDITPLTAASTSTQLVLGSESSERGWPLEKAQRLSLLGGALSALGASQAADLTGDFRVGFLLRTPPRKQWLAQAIGTIFACFIAPGTYVLFASAYSCINSPTEAHCAFQVPSAAAWRAIAVAATDPKSSIPHSSAIFSVILAVIGIISVLIRHNLWTGKWHWMRAYHPSMMLVAMAFIVPATVYSTAILMGAALTWYWMKKSPKTFELFGYAIAAGWIAGEGIGGIINAGFQIAGISGEVFGTSFGCPGIVC